MPQALIEFFQFARANKRYFVVPLIAVLAAIALAVVLARGGGSPLSYELF